MNGGWGRPAAALNVVEPDTLAVEKGVSPEVRRGLERMGHKVRIVDALGNAHGLIIRHDASGRPSLFLGASDPRGGGLAAGY
jgi:gamma-glutamyltranspeptidase